MALPQPSAVQGSNIAQEVEASAGVGTKQKRPLECSDLYAYAKTAGLAAGVCFLYHWGGILAVGGAGAVSTTTRSSQQGYYAKQEGYTSFHNLE
jgi:hypothetical protein